jgi:transposase-like protein
MMMNQEKVEKMRFSIPARSGGERSEPERSAGIENAASGMRSHVEVKGTPDPEVEAKAARRRFTSEYKLRILREAEICGVGGVASLLRREGLYSSHLTTWRRQQEAGLTPQKRGRKIVRNPMVTETVRLQRENQRLQHRLRQAEIIIDVQKKLCDVLGLTVPPIPESGRNE